MLTAKGSATKERIVDATVDVLIRSGRDSVNLDDILAATQTSKGQLFHYFPGGKDELIQAATNRQISKLQEDAAVLPDTLDEWRQWIEQIIALHQHQTDSDACEVAALAGRVLESDTHARRAIGEGFRTWHGLLDASLQVLQQHGELRTDMDSTAMAALFIAAFQGGAVADKATRSSTFMAPALMFFLDYLSSFAAGFSPPSASPPTHRKVQTPERD